MKAADIVTALRRRYGCQGDDGIGPEWAVLDELQMHGVASTRIDLLCVRAWSGLPKGHERHAIEIKVSRADLKREIDTAKWRRWDEVTHRFYLAVPKSLNIDDLDLPEEWGVLVVDHNGTWEARRAPWHDPDPLPDRTWIEAFRRASRAEARIRDGQAHDDPAATIARLEREIIAAQRSASTARQAEERWHRRADEALRLYADIAPDVHCRCGATIKLAARPFGRNLSLQWEHDGDPGDDRFDQGRPCRYPSPDLDRLAETLSGAA